MNNDPENSTPQISAIFAPPGVLRLKDVCRVTGLGRSFIYQLQAQQEFPHSIKIGLRAVGWLESEVKEWIDARVRLSRQKI